MPQQRAAHLRALPANQKSLDASGLQDLLSQAVEGRGDIDPKSRPVGIDKPLDPARRTRFRRLIKTALALLVLFGLAVKPILSAIEITSIEAVVNARIITIRAPIGGIVGSDMPTMFNGNILGANQPLLGIRAVRADVSRLDDLDRQAARLKDLRPALVARIADLDERLGHTEEQISAFRIGRLRELDAKSAELASKVAASGATRAQAEDTLRRLEQLFVRRFATEVALVQARTTVEVLKATETGALSQREAVLAERDALRQGYFVGDSYNDRPNSVQRLDELKQRRQDLIAELGMHDTEVLRIAADQKREETRFHEKSSATILLPVETRIFELTAAPGEEVQSGQEIARLIDCSQLVVTATLSAGVYNKLRIGMEARLQLLNDPVQRAGIITSLSGASTVASAFAIQPAALAKGAYRATIAIPGLSDATGCNIGRTGEVTFASGSDNKGQLAAGKTTLTAQ